MFAATEAGRLYRFRNGALERVASGFAPSILDIAAEASGAILVLEGDDRGGRLIRVASPRPSIEVWPQVLAYGDQPLGVKATRTAVVRNDGPLAVDVTLEGPRSQVGPFELEPGEHREVAVPFSAVRRGPQAVEWRWLGADGAVLARQQVEIVGLAPEVAVPEGLDFGTEWVGGRRDRQLVVENAGTVPLTLLEARVEGEGEAAFAVGEIPRSAVAPGGAMVLPVLFEPSAAGRFAASLVLSTDDPELPEARVDLSGSGGRAELDLPPRFDLGRVRAGDLGTRELVMTNSGELELRISKILTGNRKLIVTPRSLTLAPGETATIQVLFRPREHGEVEGVFRFSTNDPTNPVWVLPYSGFGVSSLLTVGADAHEFAETAVGRTAVWELELGNFHSGAVRILSATTNDPQFRVVDPPQRLAPGETATLRVEFAPSGFGHSRGQLLIETDLAEARSVAVSLAGRAPVSARFHLQAAEEGEIDAWPGDLFGVPVRLEGAHQVRGIVLEVAYTAAALEFAGLRVAPGGLLPEDGALVISDEIAEGKARVAVSPTGPLLQAGISGDGALGDLQFRVSRQVGVTDLRVLLRKAVFRFAAGLADTLELAESVDLRLELRGDLNRDGKVDLDDFFALADHMRGTPDPAPTPFDINRDGAVDIADAESLAAHLQSGAKALADFYAGFELGLHPPRPNPFNAETVLEYELLGAQRVELVIYNLFGQQVRSLVSATRPPGPHRAVWGGENDAGETVASGVYFAALATARGTRVRRLLLLR